MKTMKKKPIRKIIEQDKEGNFTKKQIKEALEKSSKLKKVIESSDIIRFKKFPEGLDKVTAQYVKKPIPVRAVMMAQEFECDTLEGVTKGKHGDYLVEGVEGEVYPCDRLIFEKTYKKYKKGDEKQKSYDSYGRVTMLVMLIIGAILYTIVYKNVNIFIILMILVLFIAELVLRYKYKKDEEKRKYGNKNR